MPSGQQRRFRTYKRETRASASAYTRPSTRSRLGVMLLLITGYWLGRFATFIPSGWLDAVDLALAALSAVLLMVWYRRRARRYLSARNTALKTQIKRAQAKESSSNEEPTGTT